MARLDQLKEAKHVAQAGAVIGREFSLELLAAVVGLDPVPLDEEFAGDGPPSEISWTA